MSAVVPARGMRDFMPDEKEFRERAIGSIRGTYAAFGYREIETPALEDLSRLASGQGGDNEKMLFSVLRRGLDDSQPVLPSEAVDLGLRFDLTLPLARFVASNYGAVTDVLRIIQIAPVWRAERPQKGRYRQFTQCDIDVIGEPGIVAEVELIVATVAALKNLGVSNSFVRLNDREILYGILRGCGFEPDSFDRGLISVDKLDKIGADAVVAELVAKVGVDELSANRLGDLLKEFDALPDKSDFAAVAALLPDAVPAAAVEKATAIRDAVALADADIEVRFDISLVRGMGYYTGPIFELGHPSLGSSIAGGGRYDKMIGRFAKRDIPACGFSIGFERILDLIDLPGVQSEKVAVLYDATVPEGRLIRRQKALVDSGYTARLVRRPKRVAATLERLRGEGFRYFVEMSDENTEPELRPLTDQTG